MSKGCKLSNCPIEFRKRSISGCTHLFGAPHFWHAAALVATWFPHTWHAIKLGTDDISVATTTGGMRVAGGVESNVAADTAIAVGTRIPVWHDGHVVFLPANSSFTENAFAQPGQEKSITMTYPKGCRGLIGMCLYGISYRRLSVRLANVNQTLTNASTEPWTTHGFLFAAVRSR